MASWSPGFIRLLTRWGNSPIQAHRQFVARNFLLDPGPSSTRRETYERFGVDDAKDDREWFRLHETYLDRCVRRQNRLGARSVVFPPDLPETFSVEPRDAEYGGASLALDLVRVVSMTRFVDPPLVTADDVHAAFAEGLDDLAPLVEAFNSRNDGRPVFASFYEDVADLLPDDASQAPADWENRLRSRFGLSHLDPPPRTTVEIVVLRYPVWSVPQIAHESDRRSLVVPSVLDSDQFAAFCPAPPEMGLGRLVGLDPIRSAGPSPEILHPATTVTPDHVFRLGRITSGAPELPPARGAHLRWIQGETGQPFGAGLDNDVLVS